MFLLSFLGPYVFDRDLPMVFAYFLAISPRKCFLKNSLHVRSCFLSRSLCLRVWVDDVVCVVSLSSLFLSRDKAQD